MKSLLFTILLLFSIVSIGQQSVVASGGDATGSSGSISYSIGQIAYTHSPAGNLNEGVQQPFEIFITSVDDSFNEFQLNLYPNPTSQELIIEMKNYTDGISASIYDTECGLVHEIDLHSAVTSIQVSDWAAASYFIRLTDKAGHSAGYQVVKH
jgi:hypothetical protein